jgi:hypothetical protein
MSYSNVDIFREKGAQIKKKNLGATEFYLKKWVKKESVHFFVSTYLI